MHPEFTCFLPLNHQLTPSFFFSSRFCWIIGESKNLLAGPPIWRNLVQDAQKRDCLRNYNGKELYEIAQCLEAKNKILESKNKIDSTNSNSSIPSNVVFKVCLYLKGTSAYLVNLGLLFFVVARFSYKFAKRRY
jgi:hypothetical protein